LLQAKATGEGGALRSLKRPVRLTWLANNPLPTPVKYYSLVSFTGRDGINKWLTNGCDILKQISYPREILLHAYYFLGQKI